MIIKLRMKKIIGLKNKMELIEAFLFWTFIRVFLYNFNSLKLSKEVSL